MSTDQNLLYQSCKAIINGSCPPALAKRTIGPVSHARWLTLAVRINFLYMSMPVSSPAVTRMATFVITVYAKLWFKAKFTWRATEASAILFEAMKLAHKLPADERSVVCPVLERGFFWGHPEQLLLGCLGSPDEDVRARAVARIIALHQCPAPKGKVGKRKRGPSNVRILHLPKPNYQANHFSQMINWEAEIILEPPLLQDYSNDQIKKFENEPFVLLIPSNSQHVERSVQLMASNATKSSDPTIRDGRCKITNDERKRRPNLDCKPK